MEETNTSRFNDRLRREGLTLLPEPVDRVGFVSDAPLSVLDGDPQALVRQLYGDGAAQSGLWEVTPGAFAAENDGFAEYMHILEGLGMVLSDDGSTLELRPGVKFITRSGWRGRWVVTETIRKIYVIWTDPQPDTVALGTGPANEEEDAIANVMANFLATVSFESGVHPDYSPLPSLFAEGARLVRTASGRPESIGIDEFVRDRTEQVRSGQLNAFSERETSQVTERFGNVAQRFSTYSKRSERTGAVVESDGIISTQFVKTTAGWRISAMAWDDERPGLTIPSRYR